MRPLFFVAFLFTIWFGVTFWYQETAHICPTPIHYRVGEIDERFSITTDEVKAIAAKAEAVWEEPLQRELFVYDETSDFAINFIYDERQQRARTEEEWRQELDAEEVKNERLIDEVKSLGAAYDVEQKEFDVKRETYNARLASYNAEVDKYNEDGGAPPAVYERLKSEADSIAKLQQELLRLEQKLKSAAENINKKGEAANESIATYNNAVLEYNDIFGVSETYTQGDFERERINVYKFSDEQELEAVLIHEFGHSLGIGHVEGESSVMYYLLTQRDSSVLSTTDREAFLAVCGESPTLASEVRRIIRETLNKF